MPIFHPFAPLKSDPPRRSLRGLFAIAAAAAMVTLAACGGGTSPTPPANPPASGAAQVRTVNAIDDAAVATLSAGNKAVNAANVDAPVSDFADMTGNAAMSLAVASEGAAAASGSSSAISVPMVAAAGEKVTVIATGDSASVTTLSVKQKASGIPAGETGVRVLHAAPRVPAVDIYVSAPDAALPAKPTIAALSFTKFAPPVDQDSLKVPKGDYQIRITEAGKTDVVFDSGKVTLPGGQDVLIAAIPSFTAGSIVNLLVLPAEGKPVIVREPRAALRAIHLSSDAPAVDVLADDKRIVRKLMFREDSRFIRATAGKLNLKVNAADTTTSVINADLDLPAGKAVSVVALNKLAAIEAAVIVDDGKAPAAGNSKLRVLHAAAGVPGVDVYLTAPDAALPAEPAVKTLEFKKAAPASGETALTIPAGEYRVRITLAGKKDVVYDSGKFRVHAREDLIAAAILPKAGDPDQPSPVDLLVVRSRGPNSLLKSKGAGEPPPVNAVQLRALHASPEAPAVDVLVDDAKAIENLSYGNFSGYKAALEGSRQVKINVAGTATNVLSAALALEKDSTYSVVAYDTPAALKALVLKDQAKAGAAVGARGYIRIANLISDAQGLPTFTGSSTGGAAFGAAAPYGENSPGAKMVDVKYTVAGGQGAAAVGFELEQGNYYTVYAIGSADPAKGKPVRLIVSRDSKP
jgi:Domain of unknown function (DUF4397)